MSDVLGRDTATPQDFLPFILYEPLFTTRSLMPFDALQSI